ncbi:carboxypeptidase B-like [Frankliniella occidentalis]|uniref:Carboxypeptidase B-like n=1 Tax=Frankliniella occidentalis TaxID=133901 RepID=A0A6J1S0R9_FRAOC|nr:carboxypeptidase B-like [Frankliniella occidentalis]
MRALLIVSALAALVAACAAQQAEQYRGWKLVVALPQDAVQVDAVSAVGAWRDVDMFNHHVLPGGQVTLMMPPGRLAAAQRVFDDKGVAFRVTNDDVQESVNAEAAAQQSSLLARAASAVPTYDRYMRYAEIQQFLQQTADAYPHLATLEQAGKSFEGRDMTALRISKNGGTSARAIFVDAGIHAREWIAPPVAIYLIQQLTQQAEANDALLDGLDWYIMPLVNPDGYEYTHTRDRFWRKNRSTQSSRWCPGTDVNRNFGYHYKQAGTSDYPCDETYAGPKAFSEPEARNLRDYILKCQERANGNVKMYLTLHSYGPMILYPWGYDFNLPDAPDKDELISIANEANKAIIRAGSEPFVVQNSAGLYPAAGASDDWSKGVANIAKAYTIELQGGGSNGFDLPANRILGVVQQLFEGMRVFAARAKQL